MQTNQRPKDKLRLTPRKSVSHWLIAVSFPLPWKGEGRVRDHLKPNGVRSHHLNPLPFWKWRGEREPTR